MGRVQSTYTAMYWPFSKSSPPSHQRIAGGPSKCLLFFLLALVYCPGKGSRGAADGSPLFFMMKRVFYDNGETLFHKIKENHQDYYFRDYYLNNKIQDYYSNSNNPIFFKKIGSPLN
jgi:hypothetical protein